MRKKLEEMLNLQEKLNVDTSWENWKEWITNKWKIINWRRCIYMELAEAIDSVSWKHWKNIEWWIDYENFKIELVDIWHFLMSELLTYYYLEDIVSLIEENADYESETKLPQNWTKEDNEKLDEILDPYEVMMWMSLLHEDSDEFLANYVQAFFVCLDSAELSFEDLYKLYIGKNVLNKFRQDHWYKEGTYKKIWNWEEDNVVMQRVINDFTGFQNIYNALKLEYENL